MHKYKNRRDAGLILANALLSLPIEKQNTIVLALPRGGVPVAYEVAKSLKVPLDVYLVRKLGVPGHKELAMGAIAEGDVSIFNKEIIDELLVTTEEIEQVTKLEKAEMARRAERYRGSKPFPELRDKTVILVDDGIATGASIMAALTSLRKLEPHKIIVAVPVADVRVKTKMKCMADKFVCTMLVSPLEAVGHWYEDFSQTEDEEVIDLLKS
jgi:putative phosphoribosyl transferase